MTDWLWGTEAGINPGLLFGYLVSRSIVGQRVLMENPNNLDVLENVCVNALNYFIVLNCRQSDLLL